MYVCVYLSLSIYIYIHIHVACWHMVHATSSADHHAAVKHVESSMRLRRRELRIYETRGQVPPDPPFWSTNNHPNNKPEQ